MKSLYVIGSLVLVCNLSFAKDCIYRINKKSIQVEWTGYKTTEKVGVTGKFLKTSIDKGGEAKDIESAVKSVQFTIDGLKFDAGNEARNINLGNHFFKKFADKAKITGEIKEISKGKLSLMMLANGVRANIPMSYKITKNKFKAIGSIEVSDFKLENALASISKACYELHKGKDGKSKTWPTVDLVASASFDKVCK